jgi:hypothetical protein
MPDVYLDLTKEVPIPADDDPEILAAIEEAREDVRQGRVYSLEQVKAIVAQWHSKSTSQKDS